MYKPWPTLTVNFNNTSTIKKKKKLPVGFAPYSHQFEVSEGLFLEAMELGVLPVSASTGKQRCTHSWSCSLHPAGFPGGQRHRGMGTAELYNKLTGFEVQNVIIWTWCLLLLLLDSNSTAGFSKFLNSYFFHLF